MIGDKGSLCLKIERMGDLYGRTEQGMLFRPVAIRRAHRCLL